MLNVILGADGGGMCVTEGVSSGYAALHLLVYAFLHTHSKLLLQQLTFSIAAHDCIALQF